VVTLAGVEPFCVPAQDRVTAAGRPEPREIIPVPVHGRSLEPETPPPRVA
jgi:hypothetical protein